MGEDGNKQAAREQALSLRHVRVCRCAYKESPAFNSRRVCQGAVWQGGTRWRVFVLWDGRQRHAKTTAMHKEGERVCRD